MFSFFKSQLQKLLKADQLSLLPAEVRTEMFVLIVKSVRRVLREIRSDQWVRELSEFTCFQCRQMWTDCHNQLSHSTAGLRLNFWRFQLNEFHLKFPKQMILVYSPPSITSRLTYKRNHSPSTWSVEILWYLRIYDNANICAANYKVANTLPANVY